MCRWMLTSCLLSMGQLLRGTSERGEYMRPLLAIPDAHLIVVTSPKIDHDVLVPGVLALSIAPLMMSTWTALTDRRT